MAEKRKRGQNFTMDEKERLVKLLLEHKDTILNKKTDGATNESKNEAWTLLTNSFNSSGTIYRNKDSLMKLWEKLKSESKIYYSSSRQNTTQTGGGPSVVKTDPILEQVCNIVGRGCTGILGVLDNDSYEILNLESIPKVICVNDPNNEIIENIREPNSNIEIISNEEIMPEQIIRTTPMWSRRRPQLSQANERTEAVATLCDSFKDVNKKKEDIEDLKRQLLIQELELKKKFYDLQLQAAAKEVEIKTEILLQVKGGGLALQNLFGNTHKKTE